MNKQKKLLVLIAIILVAAFTLTACSEQKFRVVVHGDSMMPTIAHDATVICQKTKNPSRNDIIVFKYQAVEADLLQESEYYIKRVIGIAGDTIVFEYNAQGCYDVFLNGQILNEPYISEPTKSCGISLIYYVGEKEVFVMGDNRSNAYNVMPYSYDSRSFGNVSTANITGKVVK